MHILHSTKIAVFLATIVVLIIGWFYLFSIKDKVIVSQNQGGRVIEERLEIPNTTSLTGTEGRVVEQGSVAVALMPKNDNERVIVPNAALTIKQSYDLALPEALKWTADVKLVFIKSLGAITLEGKSSQWQIAFSPKTKTGKGYEIIIQKDQIVSQKEVLSMAVGADVPNNFADRDSSWAIAQLASIPQFESSSISLISLTYSTDAKAWDYVIANSFGNSAIRVR